MVTQYLVLVALLGSPSFHVRDEATKSLSRADVSALPILERLSQHPDPEIAWRARAARGGVLRRAAEAYIHSPGWVTDASCRYWLHPERFPHLDRAARAVPGKHQCYAYPYLETPEASLKAYVNYSKSLTSGRPLEWMAPWHAFVEPARPW